LFMGVFIGGIIESMIRFGPAGYPDEAKGNLKRVFSIFDEADVNAFEYAAVYGLRISEKKATELKHLAEQYDISLSMHAAYYISLMSKKEDIRQRSRGRLLKALKFAPLMGVKRIVFHAGGYSGLTSDEAYHVVKNALVEIIDEIDDTARDVVLAPEIAGKLGAFGSVEEIIKICSEVDRVIPTIDWAHLYARRNGKGDDKESYLKVLNQFEDALGKEFSENMHFHASGIEYTEKGEKNHRPLGMEWGPDLYPLMEIISQVGYKPTFISETPNPLEGALYMKFLFEEIEKARV
jgi:deoxyribonuclease-4